MSKSNNKWRYDNEENVGPYISCGRWYHISGDRLTTEKDLEDWVYHLQEKRWFTKESENQFINCVEEYWKDFNLNQDQPGQ